MNLVRLQRVDPPPVGEEEQSVMGVHDHQVHHRVIFSGPHADHTLAAPVLGAEGIGRYALHIALLAQCDDCIFMGDE